MRRLLTLIIASLVVASPLDARELQYRIRDLGMIGGRSNAAYDINDAGQVVMGTSSTFVIGHSEAWLVNPDGTRVTIPSLGWHAAINKHGVVVGASLDSSSHTGHAGVWSADTGTQLIGEPSGYTSSDAYDINDAGLLVGTAFTSSTDTGGTAFKWTTSGFTMLQALVRGYHTRAYAVNDNGIVVGASIGNTPWQPRTGESLGPLSSSSRICMWDAQGNVSNLGLGTGVTGEARNVNNNDWIVGTCDPMVSFGSSDAFLWTREAGLARLWRGAAYGVNDFGLVVGQVSEQWQRAQDACVWSQETGVVNLPSLTGATSSIAYAINNSGVIVGSSGGHAVIWEPVPEPACVVSLLVGLSGLALRRRGRVG